MTRLRDIAPADDGVPILIGEPITELSWRAWCPYCRRYHIHGAGEGHRVAHCLDDASPFDGTGYYLVSQATAARLAMRRPGMSDILEGASA